jgi:hypothetical protein
LQIGFAWGKGTARDETKGCGFLNWKCGWAIIKGIHSMFFSTKQSSYTWEAFGRHHMEKVQSVFRFKSNTN